MHRRIFVSFPNFYPTIFAAKNLARLNNIKFLTNLMNAQDLYKCKTEPPGGDIRIFNAVANFKINRKSHVL